MRKLQAHIIKKLVLDLDISTDPSTAFNLQKELKSKLLKQLSGGLESVFDKLISPQETICIPKLEIDLGSISKAAFDKRFAEILPAQLAKNISYKNKEQITKTAIHQSRSIIQKNTALFFYFLEKGSFPWWAKNTDWKIWEKELTLCIKGNTANLLVHPLKKIIQTKPFLLDRLIWQFSTKFLNGLINIIEREKNEDKQVIQLKNRTAYKVYFKEVWLEKPSIGDSSIIFANKKNPDKKSLKDSKKEGTPSSLEKKETGYKNQNNTAKKQFTFSEKIPTKLPKTFPLTKERNSWNSTSEYFINNAGLAIALPYLPLLFKEFNYLNEQGKFKNKKSQQKAILLSQYLVTGETVAVESDLVLNKIACAWELTEPIPQKIRLNQKEKELLHTFLTDIIQHWGALKNTSPDGLRYNFLQRNGKLSLLNGHWKLQVETKSYDSFLLKKLPWTISIIKARYMTKRLQVEWIN